MTTTNEAEEKAAFAAMLLRESDPFKVALELYPDNTNRALRVANEWPKDPEVLEIQRKLMGDSDNLSFLPSKAELARDIWERMKGTPVNGVNIPTTAEEYTKLAKLYAEVRGFIEKPQNNQNVTVVVPKVIEMPTHGTDEDWEAAAAKQQRELLDVSRSRH